MVDITRSCGKQFFVFLMWSNKLQGIKDGEFDSTFVVRCVVRQWKLSAIRDYCSTIITVEQTCN